MNGKSSAKPVTNLITLETELQKQAIGRIIGGDAMKSKALGFVVFCLCLFLASAPLLAHHSFMAQFDMKKPVMVTGMVTKVEWSNPHISFFLDVVEQDGMVTNWSVDAASPTALARRGWDRTSMKQGDFVAVEGCPARNGKPIAAASMVTWADGRRMFAGSDDVTSK